MKARGFFSGLAAVAMVLATIAATPVLAGEDAQDGGAPGVKGVVSDVSGATVKLLGGLVMNDRAGFGKRT